MLKPSAAIQNVKILCLETYSLEVANQLSVLQSVRMWFGHCKGCCKKVLCLTVK